PRWVRRLCLRASGARGSNHVGSLVGVCAMNVRFSIWQRLGAGLVIAALLAAESAWGGTLRIVTYNINADTFGATGQIGSPTAGAGLTTVLQAIGDHHLNGNSQPIDVLALQEVNFSPTTTLQFIVDQLNGIYGAGTYAYDATPDPTTGNTTGNGPSALI